MKLCVPQYCTFTSSVRAEKKIMLSDPAYSFSLYSSVKAVPETYRQLMQAGGDYFLQKDYLQLLEEQLPGDLHFSYLLFFHRGLPIGAAYCQVLTFRASEHLRQQTTDVPFYRKILSDLINLRVLVCGNMLLTGQHAYYFQPGWESNSGKLIREALRQTADHWRRAGVNINTILFKDLPDRTTAFQDWARSDFHRLSFQPNMILPIPAGWHCLEDYLEALNSKYRVRYRRARKKLRGIQCRELNVQQIRDCETRIYALYRQVADSADFCVAYLPEDYFSALKARTPIHFRVWGYFRQDRLIGFCSSLRNSEDLEAHFLGLDQDQQDHQVYLNMLYHLVGIAIESGVSRLIFSRTAMAIKSSVGAIPEATSVFLTHHTSKLINWAIPYLVRLMEPGKSWEARHPFRDPEAVGLG